MQMKNLRFESDWSGFFGVESSLEPAQTKNVVEHSVLRFIGRSHRLSQRGRDQESKLNRNSKVDRNSETTLPLISPGT
jgi:hypothetical protein